MIELLKRNQIISNLQYIGVRSHNGRSLDTIEYKELLLIYVREMLKNE